MLRGSENCRYLSIQKNEMVSFTWNSPPSLPALRGQYTLVQVLFRAEEDKTHVSLKHIGMGTNNIWQKNREYFARAWGKVVLPRYKYACENGPINWDNIPSLPEVCEMFT